MTRGWILIAAVPLLWGCAGSPYVHEVGGTRMLFESPSLSRAETAGSGGYAFKAEFGKRIRPRSTGSTDAFEEDSVSVGPKYKGNLSIEQSDFSAIGSVAFRFLETGEFFLQGEISSVAGMSFSTWLLGFRSEMEPGSFTPYLEGGVGLLDVYVQSVIEKYKETGGTLFYPTEREHLGTEWIDDSKFLLFPHVSGGLRARVGTGASLYAKLRTLYLHDGFDIGAGTFLNSAGGEVELALLRRLFVNATAEISGNTIRDGGATGGFGLGLTLRL